MRAHAEIFPIEKMAKVLNVCRAGYYAFIKRGKSKREKENERLIEEIRRIHKQSRELYGSPRIHQELKKLGKLCSRKRIARLMKQEKIEAKTVRKWKHSPRSNPINQLDKNHLNQNFRVEKPNKVWASDITYVNTEEGWLYVAIVMELFSRKIIGLKMDDHLGSKLVIGAMNQAICRRKISQGLLHHSDRGLQYTSGEFRQVAEMYGIQLSMSGIGNCYDNAVAESFFHTLKNEHINFCRYKTREEAAISIFEYIESYYNRKRAHSTLGYVSPEEYELEWERSKAR